MAADKLLSAQEVADYLGIPLATLYALNSRGSSPRRLRVGRNVRYRLADVEAWVEAQMVAQGPAA